MAKSTSHTIVLSVCATLVALAALRLWAAAPGGQPPGAEGPAAAQPPTAGQQPGASEQPGAGEQPPAGQQPAAGEQPGAGQRASVDIAPSRLGPEEQIAVLDLPPKAELAINKALVWLATEQNEDGSWGTDRYYVANTALGLLAFMVQGHVPGKGVYGPTMSRAIDYLLKQSAAGDGYIVDETSAVFYQHCLATMALAEAWGQSKDPRIGPAVKRATQIILTAQGHTGGWRYGPQPTSGDISVTIMGIEALVSAKEAGVLVPDNALVRARHYMYHCQHATGGWFGYQSGNDETNTYRMGAGILGLQLAGDRSSPQLAKAIHYLRHDATADGWAFKTRADWLDQFYCVQACYQSGDAYIRYWYPRIMNILVDAQEPSGRIGGDNNLPHGATGVAVLVLAVPYRYLPIFQR